MLSPNGPKWASTRPTSPRSTNRRAQNDFHAVVHSAQTMHLSCVEINAISKRTEASFHLSHITNECHRVCPKWFPYLWDVLHKPCNYLASRLTLSPNGPKQASTWHTLPRSTIGCGQSDFHASGTFIAKPCTYLAPDSNYLQTNWNELSLDPHHLGVPSGASKMISKPTVYLAQTMHQSCFEIITISKWSKTRFHSTNVTKRYHRVCLKRFLCRGTFGTKRTPILHLD
jgi:hypothetical protein